MTDEYIVVTMSLTTIKLDTVTRDQLAALGKKNESYDTILKRLIQFWVDNPLAVKKWQEEKGVENLTVLRAEDMMTEMRYATADSLGVISGKEIITPKITSPRMATIHEENPEPPIRKKKDGHK